MQRFGAFLKNETGATAVEYGLIAGLIAVMIIFGAMTVGVSLNTLFMEKIVKALQ